MIIHRVLRSSRQVRRLFNIIIIVLIGVILLSNSNYPSGEQLERVRAFTRPFEFDYVSWTFNAIRIKVDQFALGVDRYLNTNDNHQIVMEYLNIIGRIEAIESQINDIYADPNVGDPISQSAQLNQLLNGLIHQRAHFGPLAESILQDQLSAIVADAGLTLSGQPIPPILYHSSALPTAMIISPRDIIRQDTDISLMPDMSVDQRVILEDQVDHNLNVSSLVVDVGGIGVYPTMVMQTTNLNWLVETIAHEWIHNYLTMRPLGLNYFTSPELRTMNETTASIAGIELGKALIAQFFPERVPPAASTSFLINTRVAQQAQVFDFRAEMRTTRVTVDGLLKDGKVDEAEAYMEQRRLYFWDNGYPIRKINQAYFAFYGAYADQPGGEAGEDPVGAAVRTLRSQSASLIDFINRIAWLTSFEQLQKTVNQSSP
jgi:hypothetical protein